MTHTRTDSRRRGKSLRGEVPRSSHGVWAPDPERANPVSLLQAQDEGRLEHLLPIKYGRMIASPFAFLRGSAVVMAADLATTPTTGIEVELCGDAHLSNFGVFATPERTLVFDINDFDETFPGSWEWDLKRLAASAVALLGQEPIPTLSNCPKCPIYPLNMAIPLSSKPSGCRTTADNSGTRHHARRFPISRHNMPMTRRTEFVTYRPRTILSKQEHPDHWFRTRYTTYPYDESCQRLSQPP